MQNPNSTVKMRRIGALEEDEGDDDDDGSDPEMESMGEEEEDDEMNDFDKVEACPRYKQDSTVEIVIFES